MARKVKNDLDSQISRAWARLASGVQVSVMVIPTIFKDVRAQVQLGIPVDDAVQAVIPKYRLN